MQRYCCWCRQAWWSDGWSHFYQVQVTDSGHYPNKKILNRHTSNGKELNAEAGICGNVNNKPLTNTMVLCKHQYDNHSTTNNPTIMMILLQIMASMAFTQIHPLLMQRFTWKAQRHRQVNCHLQHDLQRSQLAKATQRKYDNKHQQQQWTQQWWQWHYLLFQ